LGLSFLTGIGYKRDTLHYDEAAHDVVDMDTGEIVRHIDVESEE
jgi:formate dehydrogenase iron-sulfur subunit